MSSSFAIGQSTLTKYNILNTTCEVQHDYCLSNKNTKRKKDRCFQDISHTQQFCTDSM